jgi:hypothetical protein
MNNDIFKKWLNILDNIINEKYKSINNLDLNNKNTPENILRCENEYCNKYYENYKGYCDTCDSNTKICDNCGDNLLLIEKLNFY